MRGGNRIRLTFKQDVEGVRQTKVSPYRLQAIGTDIFLTGRSTVHRGLRDFNLREVLRVDIIAEPYRVPARLRRGWLRGIKSSQAEIAQVGYLPREQLAS